MQINKLRRIDEVNIYCFEILFVHVNILADISRCFSQILADVFSQILADVSRRHSQISLQIIAKT